MTYYRYPVNKIGITSDYGPRSETSSFHYGLDLGWYDYQGEDIYSIGNGEVIEKGFNSAAGNYVVIKHNEIDKSRYIHLRETSVLNVGDIIKMGDLLGYMGTTGNSTGVHLHIEIIRNGNYIDPKSVLYVYSDQIVGENTKRNYKLLYYNVIKVFPTVRDISKNQIIINTDNLNIRKGPGMEYERYNEYAVNGGIYDYFEVIPKGEYTWYKIGEDSFVASKDDWIKVYEKENNNEINELKNIIEEKNKEISILKEEVENLKESNKYKFLYDVKETSNYKIKLNKGEKLLIK